LTPRSVTAGYQCFGGQRYLRLQGEGGGSRRHELQVVPALNQAACYEDLLLA